MQLRHGNGGSLEITFTVLLNVAESLVKSISVYLNTMNLFYHVRTAISYLHQKIYILRITGSGFVEIYLNSPTAVVINILVVLMF